MRFKTEQNQQVYSETIWPLLAGEIGPTEISEKYGINCSTVGMWATNARKRLGGKEPAKHISQMILRGELTPSYKMIEDIRPQVLLDHIKDISEQFPQSINTEDSLDMEELITNLTQTLLLKAKGLAERGYINSIKQDSAGRSFQIQQELTPKDIHDLVEVIHKSENIIHKIVLSRFNRSQKVKELEEREAFVDNAIALLQQREEDLITKSEQFKKGMEALVELQDALEKQKEALDLRESKVAERGETC